MTDYRHFKFGNLISMEDLARMREDAEAMKQELASLEMQKKEIEDRAGVIRQARQRLVSFLEQLA